MGSTSPLRIAIWCAVSSKPQAADDKTSLQDQEAAGRKFAAALGAQAGASPKEVRLWNPRLRAIMPNDSRGARARPSFARFNCGCTGVGHALDKQRHEGVS